MSGSNARDGRSRLKAQSRSFGDDLKSTLADLGHKGLDGCRADSQTPLMIATAGNAREAAVTLVACGANVDARADDGRTPLFVAAENDAHAVAELLIERGADMNAKTKNGNTPLDYASSRGHCKVQALLR